jgi:hypothetical protein
MCHGPACDAAGPLDIWIYTRVILVQALKCRRPENIFIRTWRA